MKTNRPAVLTLVVPEPERRVYAKARAILVRQMKTSAPELGELILHELRLRKPQFIAEEYLDSTGWLPCERRSNKGKPRRENCRKLLQKKATGPVSQIDYGLAA